MTTARIIPMFSLIALTLGGCALHPRSPLRTSYEKICRSQQMTDAAAREAFWCWHQVGASSYEEWIEYESRRAVKQAKGIASR